MKILILGGDGFCGWPTALYLSREGHEIIILDNLSRRKIDIDLGCSSLTPIRPVCERLSVWKAASGCDIAFLDIDLATDYFQLVQLLRTESPDALIHFAEQRAAPYSMKDSDGRRYTVRNNINATHNLLSAIVESGVDAHVVHLGTMGVYGYGNIGCEIPEGYLKVLVDDGLGSHVEKEIAYPPSPGSIYHMTKVQDSTMFEYYNRNDGVKVTDLHQGIVWGTQTDETGMDERLINRFDYDGEYGTVLNRFIVQAAVGHPLTVYGSGGQTRAFIHMQDVLRCIELALVNPPGSGDRVRIFNQMTEIHTVGKLAEIVSELTNTPISHLANPRNEAAENDLCVNNSSLTRLGLVPTTLSDSLVREVQDVAIKYIENCDVSKIASRSYWNRDRRRRTRQ